jgi:hypothetical protein
VSARSRSIRDIKAAALRAASAWQPGVFRIPLHPSNPLYPWFAVTNEVILLNSPTSR